MSRRPEAGNLLKSMRHSKTVTILVAIMLLAASSQAGCAGTGISGANLRMDMAMQQVVAVSRGDIAVEKILTGEMKVRRTAELTFDLPLGVETTLVSLSVEAGQEVKAGEVIAAVDDAPLQRAIAEREIELRRARAELDRIRTPFKESQIALARVRVAKAKAALLTAQEDQEQLGRPNLDELQAKVQDALVALEIARIDQQMVEHSEVVGKRIRDLEYARDWQIRRLEYLGHRTREKSATLAEEQEYAELQDTHRDTLTLLELAYQEAEATRKAAGEVVRQAEEELATSREKLAEAQAGVESSRLSKARDAVTGAEVELAKAEEDLGKILAGPDADLVARAEEEVEERKRALEEAQQALLHAELVAPFDGVFSQVPALAGQRISSRSTIAVISDLTTMEAIAAVDEGDISALSEGMVIRAALDAFPGETYQGTVGPVPLEPRSTDNPYDTTVIYDVPMLFDYGDLPLKPGMRVTVRVELDRASDVLRVPAMAIQIGPGGAMVTVQETAGGPGRQVTVRTGLNDGMYVEILEGLNEGDQIIVPMAPAGSGGISGAGGAVRVIR